MKLLCLLAMASMLCLGMFTTGCQTSHSETDTPRLFGGNTHEETTVTKNPITGDTSVTHTEQKTR